MAARMASAFCPASGGTDVSTPGFAAWHPVHDAAPGGASSTARARVVATQAHTTRAKRRRAFIARYSGDHVGLGCQEHGAAACSAAAPKLQTRVRPWFFSGKLRTRLPVAGGVGFRH